MEASTRYLLTTSLHPPVKPMLSHLTLQPNATGTSSIATPSLSMWHNVCEFAEATRARNVWEPYAQTAYTTSRGRSCGGSGVPSISGAGDGLSAAHV